ncbi:SGNH family hydrolase [Tardiphaga sp.]|uniref:SGNH/GDSL hydrolase family protein n=1 Tax=Tardiphaga sp. TaxID=1926292 RepID=UPI002620B959|nr:SGNH family hydrolase [Tardiphaga sp.]MDB5617957.1 hypothetical protein [Tardiphaga sp.]
MAQKPKMTWLSRRGALLAVAGTMLFGIIAPASAQLFDFGRFSPPPQRQQQPQPRERGFGWFSNESPFFAPFQQQAPKRQAPREDFSRAPASERRDTIPERNVLVLGDSMADWLGYGLDDAYSEQPDMGVIRKHKTVSGLLRYQPKGDPADWAAAAKAILATEKPDAIVVMLGLNDRIAIREPDKADKKGRLRPDGTSEPSNPGDDADSSQDIADPGAIVPPEKTTRPTSGGVVDFRDDRWGELYTRKIEEMIAVVKARGVPVLWVGLPAVRGTKATADMLYLNNLYRDAAGKAGITYVDVWDGFVDEGGRFLQQGPDFEGQIRRLRAYDGVYFTRAGARKLAHYVEREITRLMASRSGPVALPSEPATPDANAVPGAPPPRPLAGPIVPLVASVVGTDQLLGGPGVRPVAVDALTSRTLVRGEALAAPAGRADDFAWPRREVGREQARGEPPVAAVTPGTPGTAAMHAPEGIIPVMTPPAPPKPKRPKPVVATEAPAPSGFGGLFGFDEPRRQPAPPPQRPRPGPRPPANVGPSASAPGFFTR